MPSFFRHTLRSRIQNLNLFWGPQKFLGASEAGKKKSHASTIFWAKNKIRMNFLWDKQLEFLLFNEVLKNLIFFHLPIKKIGFITLIMTKFQILKAYLWLIYRKRVEFIVYTFIFEFWKINFFELLRPSRTSVQVQKCSNFGFLTFKYALKN